MDLNQNVDSLVIQNWTGNLLELEPESELEVVNTKVIHQDMFEVVWKVNLYCITLVYSNMWLWRA